VRRSRTDLRARVNGDLQLELSDVALTSYAGLELFGRYLRATRFNAVVRTAFAGLPPWGDFGAVAMVRLVIGLLVVGGRRLRHVAFVHDDPLFRRFCEVPGGGRWPRTSRASWSPRRRRPGGRPVWVAIYRKHVHHRATKNYQLDLFDPNDGHYEYSAVTSNLDLTLANLWRFACGRGNHEKTIAQLKTGLAFHTVPTMTYAANSAWQQVVVLTHNLLTNFQIETGAVRRTPSRKRTVLHVLQTIQSLRFTFFNRAAQLVRPQGALRLRLMDNLETRRIYERVARALPRAS